MTSATNPTWEWNNSTGTYEPSGVFGKTKCHTGNTAIYTEPNGGTLFIGGWNNGAIVTNNTHVIDLTGSEDRYYNIATAFDARSRDFLQFVQVEVKGWLSLPFVDMKTPNHIATFAQWHGIAMTIQSILKDGTDVLVACLGGHGRSGLFCAIVGYILDSKNDSRWESPVAHIRNIHCYEAVETPAQEQFVYNVLGLDIPVTRQYTYIKTTKTMPCPICGTDSAWIKEYGMCIGCESKFAKIAPLKHDLTVEDIENPLTHTCTEGENCIGIFTADVCKHTVHNQIIADGLCEICHWEENKIEQAKDEKLYGKCVFCARETIWGNHFGICYECSEKVKNEGSADFVHNSILDPYKAVPHGTCHPGCVGIMIGDVCQHVVHDREIVDGLCPLCYDKKHPTEVK